MNSVMNACHDDKRREGIHPWFCKWGKRASYLECLCGSGGQESIIILCEFNEVYGEGEVG